MLLKIHVYEAEPYDVGPNGLDDLAEAIEAEATTLAEDADARHYDGTEEDKERYRQSIIAGASHALRDVGDSYRDPTGVLWTLEAGSAYDDADADGSEHGEFNLRLH